MKKKARQKTIDAFFKAIYPEYTELAIASYSEDAILTDATDLIIDLRNKREQWRHDAIVLASAWATDNRPPGDIIKRCEEASNEDRKKLGLEPLRWI